jgi:hypothetical protein
MADEKIQISWNELKTSKVEKHVRQQQAVARNRRYAQLTADDLPLAESAHTQLWYNPILYLAAFGLLGGLLAWAGGALMHLAPDRRAQAGQAISSILDIRKLVRSSANDVGITQSQADSAIHNIVLEAGNNPYLEIQLDGSLSALEKQRRIDALAASDYWRNLIANVLAFGLCGMFISVGLSVAEPVVDRNMHAVVVNGSVGAALGLLGGLGASVVVDRIYHLIGGTDHGMLQQYVAQCVSWAVLGSFVALAPGVVARNRKRLWIGLAGGAAGGAIGGILLEPLSQLSGSPEFGRLAAICCIGAITGAATGIIENVTRTGWLKVTAGPIAGKQFILYRNPTYIGSAPDCQIFLFRDPKVGRRHAAIHLVNGRIEIEDLPLGAPTYINREPIHRQKLRHGDQIMIGATAFLYQEKIREASAAS